MVELKSWDDYKTLPKNSWGIPEPTPQEQRVNCFEVGGLDLIIMPGLAFDKQGNRIGYGKGYYDRFLDTCTQFATEKGIVKPRTST